MPQNNNKRTIFAPAKINLALHVLGRRLDGYHKLDSLVAFADIGDIIEIIPAQNGFSFDVKGAFAQMFSADDRSAEESSGNLVVRAVYALARVAGCSPDIHVTLTKNLPLAAGIGGGSSDAATTLHGLADLWGLPKNAPFWPALLRSLGADMPVCMACAPSFMRGIGEDITPAGFLPEMPVVLVNPMKPCPTRDVFLANQSYHAAMHDLPENAHDLYVFCDYLRAHKNTLEEAAMQVVPEIRNVLTALTLEKNCLLSRLSGSGATCFGIYDSAEAALAAANRIHEANPDWWVKSGWLNRIERY